LTTLSGSNVCCISSLATLDLSSNRLTELPRFKSARLEELAVADNRLGETNFFLCNFESNMDSFTTESLSPLEDLPALHVLDASSNQLRTLPFSIGALSQLAEVHLRNNSLEVLPASLGMCQSLRLLDVSDNKLELLPIELSMIAVSIAK
jgi:Leucine-rich repeat (LRR) protein